MVLGSENVSEYMFQVHISESFSVILPCLRKCYCYPTKRIVRGMFKNLSNNYDGAFSEK